MCDSLRPAMCLNCLLISSRAGSLATPSNTLFNISLSNGDATALDTIMPNTTLGPSSPKYLSISLSLSSSTAWLERVNPLPSPKELS